MDPTNNPKFYLPPLIQGHVMPFTLSPLPLSLLRLPWIINLAMLPQPNTPTIINYVCIRHINTYTRKQNEQYIDLFIYKLTGKIDRSGSQKESVVKILRSKDKSKVLGIGFSGKIFDHLIKYKILT